MTIVNYAMTLHFKNLKSTFLPILLSKAFIFLKSMNTTFVEIVKNNFQIFECDVTKSSFLELIMARSP